VRRNPLHRALRSAGPLATPLGSVVRVATGAPHVVLTFDDGPRPGSTDAVLDALSAGGATATFFLLAGRVRRAPHLAARLVGEGHEVALHGLDHRPYPTFVAAELVRRTREGVDVLQQATGAPVRWVRPPYGRQTLGTWVALRRCGLTPVLWSATLWDSRDVEDAVRLQKATTGVGAGDVLLAHDSYADCSDGVDDGPEPDLDRGALIGRLLASYADRGLVGVSLATALGPGRAVRRGWFSS
jgi:peptidoglycan/xylan/chitin deacetylase (PgdA/CDA1 family)